MSYVNFPHQINDIKKLVKMLAVADNLIDQGKPLDDSTFGYALFDQRFITSRSGYTKQTYQKLPLDRQSPVITAREIKRTFRLFGFLEAYDDKFFITNRGKELIKFANNETIEENEILIWREALLNLKFFSSADVQANIEFRFRPIYVMMKLLEIFNLERRLLVFALTVENESPETINKLKTDIQNILNQPNIFKTEIKKYGLTESNSKNNIKILPTLAIKVGLFESDNEIISLSETGKDYLEYEEKRKPIWYMDLDSDDSKRQCKACILLSLNKGNIKKDILESIIQDCGFSSSIIDEINAVKISKKNGQYGLEDTISFDLYQDIPSYVRHSRIFSKFSSIIQRGEIVQKIQAIKKGTKLYSIKTPVSVTHKRKQTHPRKLTDRNQLSRSYNPPTVSVDEQLQRSELLQERDSQHQETVKKIFDKFKESGWTDITEGRYDLLAKKGKIKVLNEIKTITQTNEASQIMKALGQLHYYEYFELHECKGYEIVKIIVFDKKPSDLSHIEFLRSQQIFTLWFDGDILEGNDDSMQKLSEILN